MLLPTKQPGTGSAQRVSTITRRYAAVCCAGLVVVATGCAKGPEAALDKEVIRQSATNFYQALFSPAQSAVDGYVATTYSEHQAGTGFTLNGLKAYAQTRLPALGDRRMIIHRTLVQGSLVALHVEEKVAADSSVARVALFRFDDKGKITNHWEAVQGQPRRRANPNTMFDGAAVNYLSPVGVRGRDAANEADRRAFNNYDTLIVRQSRARVYIQHNPFAPDGPNGLINLLSRLKNAGVVIVRTNHQLMAEGDFVLTLNDVRFTAPGSPSPNDSNVFDIVRLDEAGKLTEHWDVVEAINTADKPRIF